jgi:hypothetical protein
MRHRLLAVVGLIAALAALTAAPTASADRRVDCVLVTSLTPAEEVRPPDTTDPVQSQARGLAVLRVRENGEIRFNVVILNPARETFVAGHIHEGAAGENGPVRVTLFGGSSSNFVFVQHGEVTTTAKQAAAICDNPTGFYVNYHTTLDPEGAVRGQLD